VPAAKLGAHNRGALLGKRQFERIGAAQAAPPGAATKYNPPQHWFFPISILDVIFGLNELASE
jgi:hypothetical protein